MYNAMGFPHNDPWMVLATCAGIPTPFPQQQQQQFALAQNSQLVRRGGGKGGGGERSPNRTDEAQRQQQDGKWRGGRRGRPNHIFNGRNVRLNAKICQVSEKGNLNDLLGLASSHLVEMNCVNLSTMLHRVARIAKKTQQIWAVAEHPNLTLIRAKVESELVDQIRQQLDLPGRAVVFDVPGGKTDSLPRCWATIAWCYATLQVRDVKAFGIIANLATANLDAFKTFELANLLWGFAKVRMPAPNLFEEAAKHIPGTLVLFSPVSISTVAWAYVTLMSRPPAALLKWLTNAFLEQIEAAESQEIANMCWSLATAKMAKPHIFQMLGHAAVHKLRNFNIQELANTAWAFSRAGLRHNDFFAALRTLFGDSEGIAQKFHAQGLANLLWALAKQVALGMRISTVLPVAIALLPVCRRIMSQLKPQEFSSVLWSVAKLDLKRGTVAEADMLFEAAAKMDVQRNLSPQGLTNVLYAFTEFVGTTPCTAYSNFLDSLARVMLGRIGDFEPFGLIYIVESAHLLLLRQMPVPHIETLATAAAAEVAKLTQSFTATALVRLAADFGRSGIAVDPESAITVGIARRALSLGFSTFQPHEVALLAQACGLAPEAPSSEVNATLQSIAAQVAPMRVQISGPAPGRFNIPAPANTLDSNSTPPEPDENPVYSAGELQSVSTNLSPESLQTALAPVASATTSDVSPRVGTATVEFVGHSEANMADAVSSEQVEMDNESHEDEVDTFPYHPDTRGETASQGEGEDIEEDEEDVAASPKRTGSFSVNRIRTAEFIGGSWVDQGLGGEAGDSSSAEDDDRLPTNRIMTAEFLGGSWVDSGIAVPPVFPTQGQNAPEVGTVPTGVVLPGFYMPASHMHHFYGQGCGGFPQYSNDLEAYGVQGTQWTPYDSSRAGDGASHGPGSLYHGASEQASNNLERKWSSFSEGALDQPTHNLGAPSSERSQTNFRRRNPNQGAHNFEASRRGLGYGARGLGRGGIGRRPAQHKLGHAEFTNRNFHRGVAICDGLEEEEEEANNEQMSFGNDGVSSLGGPNPKSDGRSSQMLMSSKDTSEEAVRAISVHSMLHSQPRSREEVATLNVNKGVSRTLMGAERERQRQDALAWFQPKSNISKRDKGFPSHDSDRSRRVVCVCGADFGATDLYCRLCGGKRPAELSCMCACGTPFLEDALFCSQCGAKRPSVVSDVQCSASACVCGAVFMDNAAFCSQCGAKRSVQVSNIRQLRAVCSCGTPFIGDAVCCWKCGSMRAGMGASGHAADTTPINSMAQGLDLTAPQEPTSGSCAEESRSDEEALCTFKTIKKR